MTTKYTEAAVTINGQRLTVGQSATIRVAVENLAGDLANEGLKGLEISNAYLARIEELRGLMYGRKKERGRS